MTNGETLGNLMWRYQHGFQAVAEIEAEALLAQTGFMGYPEVMLIGIPAADSHDAGISIEPSEGIYVPADLDH